MIEIIAYSALIQNILISGIFPDECNQISCSKKCAVMDKVQNGYYRLCNEHFFPENHCTRERFRFDYYLRMNNHRACRCRWQSGYTGPDCMQEVDACVPYACANGGTCLLGEEGNRTNNHGLYACQCTNQYEGHFCEERKSGRSVTGQSASSTSIYIMAISSHLSIKKRTASKKTPILDNILHSITETSRGLKRKFCTQSLCRMG